MWLDRWKGQQEGEVAAASAARPAVRAGLRWRLRLLTFFVVLFWAVLAARLVQIQWLGHADFSRQASRQRVKYEEIPARPADILDREGRVVLATTVSVPSVYVVPSRVKDLDRFAVRFAAALQLDKRRFLQRLQQYRKKHFLWAKRAAEPGLVRRLERLRLSSGTWGVRREYVRRYPLGHTAAHVIGIRDIDGHPRSGLEKALNPIIGGRPGRRRIARDALGRVIDVRNDWVQPPVLGRAVATTLDVMVQVIAERHLDELMNRWRPKHAAAIVLVPQTGEILAMASRPTFDPNHPERARPDAWLNYALSAVFEPGSTVKPLLVAWAVDQGLVAPDETFDCESGAYRMGNRVLHDHHPYGVLSVTDILVKSSNIGMAKIGERLTNEGLYAALLAFGFGRPTGVELSEEAAGYVRPLPEWTDYSTGSVPMGQEFGATALQVITAYTALANGGKLSRPTFVRRGQIRTYDAERFGGDAVLQISPQVSDQLFGPNVVSQTISESVARWLVRGPLTEVVVRGTGRLARLPGYSVFGKTGTAQKVDPRTGRYSDRLHVCSFVCGAPAENPRVLVLVVVDEPSVGKEHFGGTVAAPAAAAILKFALRRLGVSPSNHELAENSFPRATGRQ